MRTYKITALIKHEVMASPQEVIENYVDYGHEVYAHGKYSKASRFGLLKKNISRIEQVSYKIISPTQREVTIPIVLFNGLIKYMSTQRVALIPWSGIISNGKNIFGLPMGSRWLIWRERAEEKTQCWVIYETEVPWFLFFVEPALRVILPHLRKRVWEEDRIMLERRDRLIKRGFA
mgnify:CR=1 FL=1